MENIEFIPASNLPITEGSEVDVLCVENGELKRKAISLGGDPEYDLILRVVGGWDEETGNNIVNEYEVIQGSYDAVKQKIDSGIVPKVIIVDEYTNGDYREKTAYECGWLGWFSHADQNYEAIYFDSYFDLLPDNTVATTRY